MLIGCGKVNFTNLSRYSELNEKTYRQQFSEEVDFGRLNAELIQAAGEPEHQQLLVIDSSFLCKSGKATAIGAETLLTLYPPWTVTFFRQMLVLPHPLCKITL